MEPILVDLDVSGAVVRFVPGPIIPDVGGGAQNDSHLTLGTADLGRHVTPLRLAGESSSSADVPADHRLLSGVLAAADAAERLPEGVPQLHAGHSVHPELGDDQAESQLVDQPADLRHRIEQAGAPLHQSKPVQQQRQQDHTQQLTEGAVVGEEAVRLEVPRELGTRGVDARLLLHADEGGVDEEAG